MHFFFRQYLKWATGIHTNQGVQNPVSDVMDESLRFELIVAPMVPVRRLVHSAERLDKWEIQAVLHHELVSDQLLVGSQRETR